MSLPQHVLRVGETLSPDVLRDPVRREWPVCYVDDDGHPVDHEVHAWRTVHNHYYYQRIFPETVSYLELLMSQRGWSDSAKHAARVKLRELWSGLCAKVSLAQLQALQKSLDHLFS